MYVCLHVHVCHKNCSFGLFPVKKSLEKVLRELSFAFRHRECDGQLQVHPRLSATPVSLLALVCPLGVAGTRGHTPAH